MHIVQGVKHANSFLFFLRFLSISIFSKLSHYTISACIYIYIHYIYTFIYIYTILYIYIYILAKPCACCKYAYCEYIYIYNTSSRTIKSRHYDTTSYITAYYCPILSILHNIPVSYQSNMIYYYYISLLTFGIQILPAMLPETFNHCFASQTAQHPQELVSLSAS